MDTPICVRCKNMMTGADDAGWYRETETGRVHECGGKPHLVVAF